MKYIPQTMRENLYLETAKFYDGGSFRNFSEDIELYKTYIKNGAKILDVGCGTGRVALELVKQECEVTAIDLSETMLEIFETKVSKTEVDKQRRIKIIKLDMINFDLGEQFDLIIFPFRVFQALNYDEQRNECLRTMKSHLKEQGKIIINAFNPNKEILDDFSKISKVDYEYFDEQLSSQIKRSTIGEQHDAEKQIIKSKYIFEITNKSGLKSFVEERIILGYQTKEQMDLMFNQNGLSVEKLYSWWDKSEYIKDKQRELIYILTLE